MCCCFFFFYLSVNQILNLIHYAHQFTIRSFLRFIEPWFNSLYVLQACCKFMMSLYWQKPWIWKGWTLNIQTNIFWKSLQPGLIYILHCIPWVLASGYVWLVILTQSLYCCLASWESVSLKSKFCAQKLSLDCWENRIRQNNGHSSYDYYLRISRVCP